MTLNQHTIIQHLSNRDIMTQINHVDTIMSILGSHFNNYPQPLVSRDKWTIIPKTPFTVLISCLLSLRTKDMITEEASIRLLNHYHTPQQILTLSENTIQNLIYPVGFYKVKAKRIKKLSKTLIESYDGQVPNDFNTLLSLHGVGRKTANIVMVYGFNNSDYLPIDTHCHRIPNRLGWISTRTPEETEAKLKIILPPQYWKTFNHLFVTFGQTICTPISPYCSKCPIRSYCLKENVAKHR